MKYKLLSIVLFLSLCVSLGFNVYYNRIHIAKFIAGDAMVERDKSAIESSNAKTNRSEIAKLTTTVAKHGTRISAVESKASANENNISKNAGDIAAVKTTADATANEVSKEKEEAKSSLNKVLSVENLCDEYNLDADQANKKYKTDVITIKSKILKDAISLDNEGKITLHYDNPSRELGLFSYKKIVCKMKNNQIEFLKTLKIGDEVLITGMVDKTSVLREIVLLGCEVKLCDN